MNEAILPLAITMMAGPQIMSAVVFVTHREPVKVSAAFVAGVAIAVALGVSISFALFSLLGEGVGAGSEHSTVGKVVQVALVVLLIAGTVKNYVNRETVKPPKWVSGLQTATAQKAFVVGLLIILVMPSDVVIMLTTGANLETGDEPLLAALPFVALTVLIAALPLLFYLLFQQRAKAAMPKLRAWMNDSAWLVNVIVCVIFLVLILA
jgi:hypothetical protein